MHYIHTDTVVFTRIKCRKLIKPVSLERFPFFTVKMEILEKVKVVDVLLHSEHHVYKRDKRVYRGTVRSASAYRVLSNRTSWAGTYLVFYSPVSDLGITPARLSPLSSRAQNLANCADLWSITPNCVRLQWGPSCDGMTRVWEMQLGFKLMMNGMQSYL